MVKAEKASVERKVRRSTNSLRSLVSGLTTYTAESLQTSSSAHLFGALGPRQGKPVVEVPEAKTATRTLIVELNQSAVRSMDLSHCGNAATMSSTS